MIGAAFFIVNAKLDVAVYKMSAEYFQPLQEQRSAAFGQVMPGSIDSIVRGFKSGVTKWYRNNTDIYKVWQRNYHEHIIRHLKSHAYIAEYILNNSMHWKEDSLFI
jgi:hypothetical protein